MAGKGADGQPCIKVGAVMFMPHMIITGNDTHPVFSGTVTSLFDIVSSRLKRCVEYVLVPRSVGGARLPNGSFTGAVGTVHRREVDVSSMIMMTEERLDVGDMSEFFFIDDHMAGYKRPVSNSDIAGFVKPFALSTWLLMVVSVVTVVVALYLLRFTRQAFMLPRTSTRNYSDGADEEMQGQRVSPGTMARDAVIWTCSSLLAVPVPFEPPRDMTKVLTGLWLLLSLILATVYRCNLKAMLILPKVTLPFNNVEELGRAGLPVWVPIDSVLHTAVYEADPDSTLGRFNKSIFNAAIPNNVSFGISGFLTGRHAMAAPLSAMTQIMHTHFSETGRCSAYLMGESFLKPNIGSLLFAKGSPLKAAIDPIIVSLREAGILDYFYRQSVINASKCHKPVKADSMRALDLGDFYGVFSVFAGGVVVSVGCFLVELLVGEDEEKQPLSPGRAHHPTPPSPVRPQ